MNPLPAPGAGGMTMSGEMQSEILDYIGRYGRVYSRDMLTHQLREQGFGEAAIAAAWATVDSGAVPVIGARGPGFQPSPAAEGGLGPPRPPSFAQRPLFWGTMAGWAVLSYAVPLLAAAWQGEGTGAC